MSHRAFESAASGDYLSPLAGPGHIEGKGDPAGMKSPGKFVPLFQRKDGLIHSEGVRAPQVDRGRFRRRHAYQSGLLPDNERQA